MMIESDTLLAKVKEFAPESLRESLLDIVRSLVPEERQFIVAFEIDDDYEPEHELHVQAHIFCPHCGAEDTIAEVDISTRWNTLGDLRIEDDVIWTNASTGGGNYDHDGWICESCLGRSTAPDYFEINDWS